jgi:SOS response regulatory protein OraA/RecX
MALAGNDPGVGDKQRKDSLQRALRAELRFLGMDYRIVQQLVEEIDSQYLTCWAASLRSNRRTAPERTARAIASHLLDRGFSQPFLHRWWTFSCVMRMEFARLRTSSMMLTLWR